MEALDPTTCFLVDGDDLLDFSLEGDEEEKDRNQTAAAIGYGGPTPSKPVNLDGFPEAMEEELEWISNKDAFPSVETCFGIFVDNPLFHQKSPVSVLENSSSNNSNSNVNSSGNGVISCNASLKVPLTYPMRPRSKNRRPRRTGFGDFPAQNCLWARNKNEAMFLMHPITMAEGPTGTATIGRRCQHCGVDKTPQWRAGPTGPKTLCNACGVRYKSGRLLPEYRPANSPTFSSVLHSNSHRKVMEMRRQKVVGEGPKLILMKPVDIV
ncbi:unnamed protein product [Cuscuta campestris]|uniref:GATA-type domain-containing protein n=2 Tax=Cuscuta sect. Cleistogrammica TaxID=1824901 RepID=A0A484M0Q5_9ASTE|nr:hypothetical protein DM860_001628 [Cuscuta australis]VFQ82235.1 unnamed protein product [Cuscuta campestris]